MITIRSENLNGMEIKYIQSEVLDDDIISQFNTSEIMNITIEDGYINLTNPIKINGIIFQFNSFKKLNLFYKSTFKNIKYKKRIVYLKTNLYNYYYAKIPINKIPKLCFDSDNCLQLSSLTTVEEELKYIFENSYFKYRLKY